MEHAYGIWRKMVSAEWYGRFGEEYLANVCVQFPRFTEYFGDFKEVGIGCACEEAVRIILESDLNFKLEEKNDPAGDDCDDEADEKMLNFVFALREELFKLFSNKKISTSRKLTIYLMYAQNYRMFLIQKSL